MTEDNFQYLGPLINGMYSLSRVEKELPIPGTPLPATLPNPYFRMVSTILQAC